MFSSEIGLLPSPRAKATGGFKGEFFRFPTSPLSDSSGQFLASLRWEHRKGERIGRSENFTLG